MRVSEYPFDTSKELIVPGFECPGFLKVWVLEEEGKYVVFHGDPDYTWEAKKEEWIEEQPKLAGWLKAICALIGHRVPPPFEDPYWVGPSASAGSRSRSIGRGGPSYYPWRP